MTREVPRLMDSVRWCLVVAGYRSKYPVKSLPILMDYFLWYPVVGKSQPKKTVKSREC